MRLETLRELGHAVSVEFAGVYDEKTNKQVFYTVEKQH